MTALADLSLMMEVLNYMNDFFLNHTKYISTKQYRNIHVISLWTTDILLKTCSLQKCTCCFPLLVMQQLSKLCCCSLSDTNICW